MLHLTTSTFLKAINQDRLQIFQSIQALFFGSSQACQNSLAVESWLPRCRQRTCLSQLLQRDCTSCCLLLFGLSLSTPKVPHLHTSDFAARTVLFRTLSTMAPPSPFAFDQGLYRSSSHAPLSDLYATLAPLELHRNNMTLAEEEPAHIPSASAPEITQPARAGFRFLSLPPEIRNMIYDYIFTSIMTSCRSTTTSRRTDCSLLCRVDYGKKITST